MANGDNLVLGKKNDSTTATDLYVTRPQPRASRVGYGVPSGLAVSAPGNAVIASSGIYTGVLGRTGAPTQEIVFWDKGPQDPLQAGVTGEADSGAIGVQGTSRGDGGVGVFGACGLGTGVLGHSFERIGVIGVSSRHAGVYGHSDRGDGVVGSTNHPSANYAGCFWGPVGITGDLTVWGGKSAAVPFPDGTFRLLYAVESPESWFEDFGTARLVRGRSRVKLDRHFAAVVRLTDYHVFITPEGDSRGLYVSKKSKGGFEVREQQGGVSNLRFGYRVVARRKDFAAKRFARVTIPKKAESEIVKAPARSARRRRKASAPAAVRRG